MRAIGTISFTQLDPDRDAEPLVGFLSGNAFPFHRVARLTEPQARESVLAARYWSDDSVGFWIDADVGRVGVVVVDDLSDSAVGGSPAFDLRLGEMYRGQGHGVSALAGLTDLVFTRWPDAGRFEGHTREDNLAMRSTFRRVGWVKEAVYRDAWPTESGGRVASIGYAVLRRDWESGTTTPVLWDDD